MRGIFMYIKIVNKFLTNILMDTWFRVIAIREEYTNRREAQVCDAGSSTIAAKPSGRNVRYHSEKHQLDP